MNVHSHLFSNIGVNYTGAESRNFLRRRIGVRPLYLFTSAIESLRQPEQHIFNLILFMSTS